MTKITKAWKVKEHTAKVRHTPLPDDRPDRRVVRRPLTSQYNGEYTIFMQISLPREPWLPPVSADA